MLIGVVLTEYSTARYSLYFEQYVDGYIIKSLKPKASLNKYGAIFYSLPDFVSSFSFGL